MLYMRYYEVLVGDMQYHGKHALTYSFEANLLPGSVVRIALRNRSVLGIVLREVPKPGFTAKPITALAPAPALPSQSLELIDWLRAYYPAPFGTIIRQFLPSKVSFPKHNTAQKQEGQTTRSPNSHHTKSQTAPTLTTEQTAALRAITSSGYHLLHGVTGSGKTRVYVELARRALKSGRSAIILTPEIGLTAQLIEVFAVTFPGKIHVIHSRQTDAQRRDAWYEIRRTTEPIIIIGPRSALFAPAQDLGLIVLDESHDQAYKNESAPRMRTERVAAKLAQLHRACLVSGSATPSVEEYYIAKAKNKPIIALRELARRNQSTPQTTIVDLRDRSQLSRSPILSTPLITAMQYALERDEQTLLFLNRRGTAGAVLCATCGWRALCEYCDLSFTYHGDTHIMRCHVCGRTRPLPAACPDCNEADIILKTIGTKAVVQEVARLFPESRINRFDTDTAKAEQLEKQLERLKAGDTDIIIGTQMITKGLDLPRLAVVGVLNADASLLIPDYTAAERTFQLLTQITGRANRGHRDSTSIIQTYNPSHAVIRAALEKDWASFYANELTERRTFRFPPFVYMLKLSCLRASNAAAEKSAAHMLHRIQTTFPEVIVEGPSPAFHPRESGKYKWQIIAKASSREPLAAIARDLPSGWSHDLDPVHLL